MAIKYVSSTSLEYFWTKLKAMLDKKAEKADAYVHPASGVTAGTYKSVTVDANGHVTAGTNPTTLAGYGITDAAKSDHTHKYAGSASVGGAANSVANSIVVKLNGGATEGTNMFTFNGSAGKTINITPAGIGAAAASHKHQSDDIISLDAAKLTGTISIDRLPAGALERCIVVPDDDARKALTVAKAQVGDTVKVTATGRMYMIVDDSKLNDDAGYVEYSAGSAANVPWSGVTGKPTTLGGYGITDAAAKNHTHNYAGSTSAGGAANSVAQSISIALNGGTTEGTNKFTFNGSAAKSINITPASIGASASNHTHNYAGSSSVGGAANSAVKLTTARAIDGVNFDGQAAITHFGSCSTEAATAAKVVAVTGFTLVAGARVAVKFTVTNTAANPTLNVNNTGAKSIFYRGAAIAAGYLAAKRVYEFIYDGTNFELVGDIDTNTTYSSLKNPYAITIQAEGTTVGSAYDGSSAKTINITRASLGISEMTTDDIDTMMSK